MISTDQILANAEAASDQSTSHDTLPSTEEILKNAGISEEPEVETEAETEDESELETEAETEDEVKDEPEEDYDTFTVKVDGEEIKVSLEDLLSGYEMRSASQKRFNDAAAQIKQLEAGYQALSEDPFRILEEMGFNLDSLIEDRLMQQFEMDNMSEAEKELYELKKKFANSEEERQREIEKQEALLVEQATDDYLKEIHKELAAAGLPQNDYLTQKAAGFMYEILESDDPELQDVPMSMVIELVKDSIKEDFQQLEADQLVSLFGEKVAESIRQKEVERFKNNRKNLKTPSHTPKKKAETPVRKTMSTEDWYKTLKDIK